LKADLDGGCRIGIAYDPVNAYFQGHDPAQGMHRLAGQIDIMHLKNVRRHADHRVSYMPRGDYSYSWTSLADGDLDWKPLLAQAAAEGFDGPLTFEYVNPFKGMPTAYWDQLREPEDAAREEAEFLRGVLAAL
jgi:sugar phosphate isomerase/epimerase